MARSRDGAPSTGPGSRAPSPSPSNYTTATALTTQTTGTALLDHSHLRVGKHAALLSHDRTLQLYRQNALKSSDPSTQLEFASFLIDAARTLPIPAPTPGNAMDVEKAIKKRDSMVKEATALLKKNADRGHMPSQYLLADCFANGLGTTKPGRQDFDAAFPLFVLAAKRGHADAAFRAGTCVENGWGCKREAAKAVQFYKRAAAAKHPGAMYRLGIASLHGELAVQENKREAVNWLKRSAEHATPEFPHALHELGVLHEKGVENVVFKDEGYAAELYAQAAELGYAPSAYALGEGYEFARLGLVQDAGLALHYYNIAAQQNNRDACFALTAWYLVGAPGVLPQSDTEAFLWAKRAADAGLPKALYACGYFSEVGVGVKADVEEAIKYFQRAAQLGDKRAAARLDRFRAPPPASTPRAGVGLLGMGDQATPNVVQLPSPGQGPLSPGAMSPGGMPLSPGAGVGASVFAQQQTVSYAGIGAGGIGGGGASAVQIAQEFNRTLEEEVEAEGPKWGVGSGRMGRAVVQ